MLIRLKELNQVGRWYRHDDGEEVKEGEEFQPDVCYHKIREFPNSLGSVVFLHSETPVVRVEGSERVKKFEYCWEDVKGLVDEEGKPIVITGPKGAEIKRLIFDTGVEGISMRVLGIVDTLRIKRSIQAKN